MTNDVARSTLLVVLLKKFLTVILAVAVREGAFSKSLS